MTYGQLHTSTLRNQLQQLEGVYGPSYGLTNILESVEKAGEDYGRLLDERNATYQRELTLAEELSDANERIETLSLAANEQADRLTQKLEEMKKLRKQAWSQVSKLEELIYAYAARSKGRKGRSGTSPRTSLRTP